ncbi:glycosyltransferase family 4 protein [Candidatus Uhrbacteria bacterium]|nr:glycosyltransferase family 4 protein [Candidatus Uhrbacteria bacterium]
MKILIATGIYPPEIGGPATVIKKLADDLMSAGHDVQVVTYGEPRPEKFVHAVSRNGGKIQRYFRMASAIRKNISSETMVLATDVFSVGIPARLALIGKKNRFRLRLGGEWWWEDSVEKGRTDLPLREFWRLRKRDWRERIARANYGWILHRTERMAVTSNLLGEVLRRICPKIAAKISVVTNASIGGPLAGDSMKPHEPLRLAYVGRFAKVKNVPFLAQTLKRINAQTMIVECSFAGDGPTLDETKRILEGVPGMAFLGKITQPDVSALLRESDVLVLPSLTDICPNIVLEALTAGTPAVMTSENGLPKDLGGIIELPPTDMDVWVKTLESLVDREKYGRLQTSIRLPSMTGSSLFDFVTTI